MVPGAFQVGCREEADAKTHPHGDRTAVSRNWVRLGFWKPLTEANMPYRSIFMDLLGPVSLEIWGFVWLYTVPKKEFRVRPTQQRREAAEATPLPRTVCGPGLCR